MLYGKGILRGDNVIKYLKLLKLKSFSDKSGGFGFFFLLFDNAGLSNVEFYGVSACAYLCVFGRNVYVNRCLCTFV